MIKRTGFGWSVDVPGFDVESLAVAIDRGDVDRVSALLDDLSKALEGEGSRLYTIAAVSGMSASPTRSGGGLFPPCSRPPEKRLSSHRDEL